MNTYKLGSLFDGSGGFPLAGTLCGIEPVWAAEVEPYPIAVTRSRFPNMRHLGDISKVSGAEIEPVDIITFGSPCQDLSVAGKRAGLKHEANGDEETTRSGLFMEAVRIIKEMRRATNGEYPRFALWENVPGAFSSNKGEDFRIVCEELIKIVEPSASMPPVPQNGWAYADSYISEGWSLSYRVFDAQYWGVPQRRRRIHLVADFRGTSAREVLFEREGLRGYFAEGRTPWQAAPADAQGSTGADDITGASNRDGGGRQLDAVAYSFDSLASNSMKSSNPHSGCREVDVSKTLDTTDPNPSKNQGGIAVVQPIPYTRKVRSGCDVDSTGKAAGKGALIQENKAATLSTVQDQYLFQPVTDSHILDDQGGSVMRVRTDGKAPTLRAQMGGHPPVIMQPVGVDLYNCAETGDKAATLTTQGGGTASGPSVICLQGNGIDRADTAGCNGKGWKEDTAYTLNTIDRPAVVYAIDQQGGKGSANYAENVMPTLCSDSHGTPHGVVYAVDQGGGKSGANVSENTAPTLCTTHGGEPAVAYGLDRASFNQGQNAKFDFSITEESQPTCVSTNYIVRRLTPTECARLQGFADWWGVIEPKNSLTEEDYQFWLEVRNTHAAINGKATKDYTVKQMLAWYNKLWTDSAEYKMWGNGIALPTALYVLQGLTDALNTEEDLDDWMN